jgi:GAF domain-containing protein
LPSVTLDANHLTDLVGELRAQPGEAETLEVVLERVAQIVPDADFVSVTIRHRGRSETLASTDERADRADAAQYALEEGPCIAAAIEEQWFRSGDVARDARWPAWGPAAAAEGVGSILAVPLLVDGALAGAINMYSTALGAFADSEEIDFAALYAVHIAQTVASDRQITGLQTALQTRHLIGAAQGILMERFGLGLDEAFAILRRYSSTTNTKLHQVAALIVTTRKLPDQQSGQLPGQRPDLLAEQLD